LTARNGECCALALLRRTALPSAFETFETLVADVLALDRRTADGV
jgi:hypothetical protein